MEDESSTEAVGLPFVAGDMLAVEESGEVVVGSGERMWTLSRLLIFTAVVSSITVYCLVEEEDLFTHEKNRTLLPVPGVVVPRPGSRKMPFLLAGVPDGTASSRWKETKGSCDEDEGDERAETSGVDREATWKEAE